jgi:hypothetical protein
MSSMGDLGREINEMRDHPRPAPAHTELERLEARLRDFFEWAHGRPHPEIREKFARDFSDEPLHDDVVDALTKGRGTEVRAELPVQPPEPSESPDENS